MKIIKNFLNCVNNIKNLRLNKFSQTSKVLAIIGLFATHFLDKNLENRFLRNCFENFGDIDLFLIGFRKDTNKIQNNQEF